MSAHDNTLRRVISALAEAGVEFVVCGGVACILQGVARATHDLDIRLDFREENLRRLVQLAQRLGLRPRVPEPIEALLDAERRRAWVDQKQAVVYTLIDGTGALTVDIFLRYPFEYEELAAAADIMDIDGQRVLVSSKRHLIDAKRQVQPARKKDIRDIEDLEELLHAE
jgi:hypothetical protein